MVLRVLSLKELASFEVAKLFWSATIKSEVRELIELYYDVGRNWEVRLTNLREESKHNMLTYIRSGYLPRHVQDYLQNDISSLQVAYHQLFLWKLTYDPMNWIDLFEIGDLYAPNYFNSYGEFNDFLWTKHYVQDSKYPIINRFNLACCYWFEEECENIWSEIKNSQIVYDQNDLDQQFIDSFGKSSFFIFLKIIHIEDVSKKNVNVFIGYEEFWMVALRQAIVNGYEYATYYIWKKLIYWDKRNLMEDDAFFELLCMGLEHPRDKIVLFLYKQLTDDRKIDLLDWTIENLKPEIWYTLLITPYAKDIHKEIILYYNNLSTEMCSLLFELIADRIKQLKIHSDMLLFEMLWRSLKREEMQYTLKYDSVFIEILAKAKSFKILSVIINSLTTHEKWKCLLYNRYRAGITVLHILAKAGEFDFLQKYLYFFLKKYKCVRIKSVLYFHQETVREDANVLLQTFIDSSDFATWYHQFLSEEEKTQVHACIEDIFASLTLLHLQKSS